MGSGNKGLYSGTYGSSKGKEPTGGGKLQNVSTSIGTNADAMNAIYPRTQSGYFGEKGKNVRVIYSNNPVATSVDFFAKIGNGGTTTRLPNGKGDRTILSDGTTIVHRLITSTKGSPAVEISISGSPNVKDQKIHFIRRDKK